MDTKLLEGINPNAKKVLEGLFADINKHNAMGKGSTVKGILLAFSDLYPKDKQKILSILRSPDGTQLPNKKKVFEVDLSPDPNFTGEHGCTDCQPAKKAAPKLTDAKDAKGVYNYFVTGVGEETGEKRMREYLASQGVKHNANVTIKWLSEKIYKHTNDPNSLKL